MSDTSSTMSMQRFPSIPTCSALSLRCILRQVSRACREEICSCCSTGRVREGPDKRCRIASFPAPGGWNRIQIEVDDLEATVEKLKGAGARFRNQIVTGNGGKQILVEDPSGNQSSCFNPSDHELRNQRRAFWMNRYRTRFRSILLTGDFVFLSFTTCDPEKLQGIS